MSSIKKNFLFWIMYYFSVLSIFFFSLILIDYYIPRIANQAPISAEIKSDIEHPSSSISEYENLIHKGYHPAINLAGIERNQEIRNLTQNTSVLGIGSYPNKNLLYCDEGYGWKTYVSDKYGYRNLNSQYDSDIDVAIFGDSFIHGGCVSTPETITQVMSKKKNVLGFGLGGSDPIHYAAMIRAMIPVVQPQKAGIAFYNNDFNDSDRSSIYFKHWLLNPEQGKYYFSKAGGLSAKVEEYYQHVLSTHSALIEHGKPAKKPSPKLEFKDWIAKIEKYLMLNNIRAMLYQYVPSIVPLSGISASTKIAIDELIDRCKIHKCEPFITYLPNSNYWNPSFAAEYYGAQLKYYSERNSVKFISLDEIIDRDDLKNFSPRGGHYSIEAYNAVGNYLLDHLYLKD